MKIIKNETYSCERALYNISDTIIDGCTFASSVGESPLKETNNIIVKNSNFSIRYALWHVTNFEIDHIAMDELARATLWYCYRGVIKDSKLHGIKVIRECSDIVMENCDIDSDEFGWRSNNITIKNCDLNSVYPFLMSSDIKVDGLKMTGKYSFQYTKNIEINNASFVTKDAFWHTENAVIRNSSITSEYVGWYSKNLTLINCVIEGTQPFCYCENLKLIDCKMVNCDLAFEYSSVNATIIGDVVSIKNPLSGEIVCDGVQEIITSNQVKPCTGIVTIRKKGLK